MMDFLFKASSQAAFDAYAKKQGWTDEAPGVNIDYIGAAQLTQGTYDEDGGELTPPTFDPDFHVNVRLVGKAAKVLNPVGTKALQGKAEGWTQFSSKGDWVVMLDPETINSPLRVWFGD